MVCLIESAIESDRYGYRCSTACFYLYSVERAYTRGGGYGTYHACVVGAECHLKVDTGLYAQVIVAALLGR